MDINLQGVDPYTGNTLAYVDGFDDDGNRLGTLNTEENMFIIWIMI